MSWLVSYQLSILLRGHSHQSFAQQSIDVLELAVVLTLSVFLLLALVEHIGSVGVDMCLGRCYVDCGGAYGTWIV